ncbi:MAG: GerW family sporulation protein [Clostridia bacterium]|nr:GerW family sporulation protein [Clostridia bacterium]
MSTHPINELMTNVMGNLKQMVDVNTIVGSPVETADGTTIIPVSKVGFGFAAGGSDFGKSANGSSEPANFGGGSGAGVSIAPIGFLVVSKDQIRMIPVTSTNSAVDKLVDYIPTAISKVNSIIEKHKESKEEE